MEKNLKIETLRFEKVDGWFCGLYIAEAVCRLIDTSDTIAEICYKSGFNNLSNFNRAFKRRKGNTPTEYREKYARTRFRI